MLPFLALKFVVGLLHMGEALWCHFPARLAEASVVAISAKDAKMSPSKCHTSHPTMQLSTIVGTHGPPPDGISLWWRPTITQKDRPIR